MQGKSNAVANLLAQDRIPGNNITGGLRKLSIYSEIEKTKVGGRISLSTDSKKSAMLNSTAMQHRATSLKAKMRVSLAEASGDHHILMKVSKELKAAGDDSRAKARCSVVATIGNRKSLPVLKQANALINKVVIIVISSLYFLTPCCIQHKKAYMYTNLGQENAKRSEKGIGKQGFSVSAKPKIGRKILSQENAKCSENGIGKQRLPVSAKPKAGRNVLPQPVLKTTFQMASRQKRMHCPSSSKFQSVISSQKKEELVTSSLSNYIAPKSFKQPSQEVPSKNNHDLVTSESNILIRRASVRRKSFTSLLMTRPKQLKEQTGHTKQEFLPNIYDNSNHLDVSEYVDDIYQYYWVMEIMDLISVSAESYTREQMLGMEKAILKKLLFRLNVPTPYVFMLRFLKASQANKKLEHLAFFLVELCLVEFEALNYKPSLLCASAIYLARCTMQMTPAWTPLLERHACYEEFQLRDCAEMILRFHKAARTTLLKVTCEKYMRFEYSKVAAIKPLEAFPQ
nr:putative cyclin-B3-1 [Ipomoea batatas]